MRRRRGKQPPTLETEEKPPGKVVDLMAALEESVSKAQASRAGSGKDATVHDMPKKGAAKNTTAKKAVAKETATKKTAAKKSAGKKTTAKKRSA